MNDSATIGQRGSLEIAVIGMAGRFPGAKNIDEFWRNLRDGVESVTFFSDEELQTAGVDPMLLRNPHYVKAAAVLEGGEWFDASFFGFNPKEAEILDPQQRLFLECAWEALENAGYDSERYQGLIGVFAGAGMNTYLFNLFSNRDGIESVDDYQMMIGNDKDYLSTRVSYKLNLEGPSVAVQTACSTSLVAVHFACQSLLRGECDMALAGGVSLNAAQKQGTLSQERWIVSPDGHCRPFDAKAKGTVRGSGLGIVVLKRLADALAERDAIHAVLKGSAINNDGALKIGYTAPRVEGQANVIRAAHLMAEIEADTITYLEAHGTGTELGDPIEIAALHKVFRARTDKKNFCALGSVKSNFGHADAAAGIAGLLKTILALEHKMIPPSLHFEQPNPQIDFANSPFYVNTKLSEWQSDHLPRRAGVSSFGIGGTNAHVIIEEAPVVESFGPSRAAQLLVLSAKTSSGLEAATDHLAAHFVQHPEQNLADVAYTLQVGRRAFTHRRMLVCHDRDDAINILKTREPRRIFTAIPEHEDRSVVFIFPGQGAQYVNMARELHETEPIFREHIERSAEFLQPLLGLDLRDLLFANLEKAETAAQQLRQTLHAQPALFVIEYALAQLWMAWGVRPQAMIGHSIGEYVAACLAGVFSLEEALNLVAKRGQLVQSLPLGAMLAISLSESETLPLLNQELSLAAVNGPTLSVVSGTPKAVAQLATQLEETGIACRHLHTSHAFHSAMMEPILPAFAAQVKKVALQPPRITYLSNVTGTWIAAEQATTADYWTKHLRQTVRFVEGLEELFKTPEQILLEVGPGSTLSMLARQHPQKNSAQVVLTSTRHTNERISDTSFLLNTVGQLWLNGTNVDWFGFYAHEQRQRVPLPTYPFERQRYWIESSKPIAIATQPQTASGKKPEIADWLYIPTWTPAPLSFKSENQNGHPQNWLIFVDQNGLGFALAERLQRAGDKVICVTTGEAFRCVRDGVYAINPRVREDYITLSKTLLGQNRFPTNIAHLWGVTTNRPHEVREARFERAQMMGFHSLIFLAQALGAGGLSETLQVNVITNNMQKVAGDDTSFPERATILGACKVIPQEYAKITCRSIDLVLPEAASSEATQLVDHLLAELHSQFNDRIVAYRKGQRWTRTYSPARCESTLSEKGRLRERGTYLITGGLGGIGLTLAEYLAQTVRANLILVGRSTLPEKNAWEDWLATHSQQDSVSARIRKVQTLEQLGAEVLVFSADVSKQEQMAAVILHSRERFGDIHGVIHAAGIAGGGVIQLKTPAQIAEVFAPKVRGLFVLESLLKDQPLDFIALCSSLTAILGDYGQADYCAANAFLDAFAQHDAGTSSPFVVSINWDAWQEVGMAVNAVARLTAASFKKLSHPLLEKCLTTTAEQAIYETTLNVKKHWVLDEHRMRGTALLPGTAFLEMARAAFENYADAATMQFHEVFLVAPLVVNDDEEKDVRTIITKNENGFDFVITSRSATHDDWQEHAQGKIAGLATAPAKNYMIAEIEAACARETASFSATGANDIARLRDTAPLVFGSRWKHLLKQVRVGSKQALALLELPETYADDLQQFKLHPALLDLATAFAIDESGVYLPFSYKSVKISAPLPKQVFSYVRWQENASLLKTTLHFEVALLDALGNALVEIADYTLIRTDETALHLFSEETNTAPNGNENAPSDSTAQNFRLEIATPGILESLSWREAPRRQPGAGEVEIEVHATGLNFKDVLLALSSDPSLAANSFQYGSECAGKIVAVGEKVEGLQIGDEVIAATPACFSGFVTTSAAFVVRKPAHLTFEEAATIPVAFMTAHYALNHLARLGKGEAVLIHAAAGGVGLAAVKLAQQAGAEIFATAGTPEKRAFLRSLGIEHVMDSRSLDFADDVMRRTHGRGADVVLNSLAGDFLTKSFSLLAPFGRFLEIGKRDILQDRSLHLRPFEKGLSFFAISLSQELPCYATLLREVVQFFQDGTLAPLAHRLFPFTEVAQAFDYMASAKHIGKIVVTRQNGSALLTPTLTTPAASSRTTTSNKRSDFFTNAEAMSNPSLTNLDAGILPKEGVAAFRRILSGDWPQVIVSTRDLQNRMKEYDALRASRIAETLEKSRPSVRKHARPQLAAAYVAPRNEPEQILTDIWQEVLGLAQVGIHDNFFELGGASIQSLQIVAKANQAGLQFNPERIFEHQTIAELAALLEATKAERGTSP